jgi:hypothetical protein
MSLTSDLLQQSGDFARVSFPSINPTFSPPKVNIDPKLFARQDLADGYYERLIEYIGDFENQLEQDKEVGLRLVSFGESILIHVTDIGYYNPYLITFTGYTNGTNNKVQLIQHVSQISFMLMAVPRTNPERPRIGFILKQKLEEQQNEETNESSTPSM